MTDVESLEREITRLVEALGEELAKPCPSQARIQKLRTLKLAAEYGLKKTA